MDYTGFTAQNFLLDDYFQEWVLKPSAENDKFWQRWLQQHPEQRDELEKARELLLALNLKPAILPPDKVSALWDNIVANTQDVKVIPLVPAAPPVVGKPIFLYRVAAVFICILFAGLALWKIQKPGAHMMLVATNFGETRTLILPDNSRVTLNGNSSLRYPSSWSGNQAREVQLQGEAYFAVTHTQNHRPFRVHLNKAVRVEVLGTRFVVTSRPQKTRIVLNEGKVKVAVTPTKDTRPAPNAVTEAVLKPGELLEVKASGKLYRSIAGNRGSYSAFLQQKIIFVDTPLSEVARVLEDTYGYKVTFTLPALANRRFTGSAPPQKIELLLKAIEKSFGFTILKKGRHLTIKPA